MALAASSIIDEIAARTSYSCRTGKISTDLVRLKFASPSDKEVPHHVAVFSISGSTPGFAWHEAMAFLVHEAEKNPAITSIDVCSERCFMQYFVAPK